MRMGANPSVSYRKLPPTLKAKRVGAFRTISSRILPEIAHVARFSDGRFYEAIFSPHLTCGVVGCDIRPVGIWHSKTVQHTLFLAKSDFKLYDRGGGYREAAVPVETPRDKSGVRRTGAICPDANKTPDERLFAEASKSLPRTVPTWRQVPFNANIVSLLYHISISLEV